MTLAPTLRCIPLACILAVVLASPVAAADSGSSFELYRAGRSDAARAAAHRELLDVQRRTDPAALWAQLMFMGWLEESLGEPRAALTHANRALEVALGMGDSFRIGRSLCWAGWSNASLGRYELALEIFDRAIQIGAPEGRIRHVAVWGLATQEKGWVLARMGRIDEARRVIGETTDFARRNEILAGVAEGGAHLAELALLTGDLREAEERSDEALRASRRCNCRDANTARALVVEAQVALARARIDPKQQGGAHDKAKAALEFAEGIGDRRNTAAAKLALSRALPAEALEQRLVLVDQALSTLLETGADLRGRAEGDLGRVMAAADYTEMARLYLASGLEVSESLFREVDSAYMLETLASVDASLGNTELAISAWGESAERARAAGAWELALDAEEALSAHLEGAGHLLLATQWTERALETLDGRIENIRDLAQRRALLERRIVLAERMAEIQLALAHPAPAGP